MAVRIWWAGQRIGLALSGEGFRAAALHLGALRKLQALCVPTRHCTALLASRIDRYVPELAAVDAGSPPLGVAP